MCVGRIPYEASPQHIFLLMVVCMAAVAVVLGRPRLTIIALHDLVRHLSASASIHPSGYNCSGWWVVAIEPRAQHSCMHARAWVMAGCASTHW